MPITEARFTQARALSEVLLLLASLGVAPTPLGATLRSSSLHVGDRVDTDTVTAELISWSAEYGLMDGGEAPGLSVDVPGLAERPSLRAAIEAATADLETWRSAVWSESPWPREALNDLVLRILDEKSSPFFSRGDEVFWVVTTDGSQIIRVGKGVFIAPIHALLSATFPAQLKQRAHLPMTSIEALLRAA